MRFDEFAGMTNAEWKQLIVRAVRAETEAAKLAFYEQQLVRRPEPGIAIQSFYTPEDMAGLDYLKGFHRLWTQTRQTTGWMNVEPIVVYDEKTANQQAREALAHGADAVEFDLLHRAGSKPMPDGGVKEHLFDFPALLHGLSPLQTPVFFRMRSPDFADLNDYLAQSGAETANAMGGIAFDETAIRDLVAHETDGNAFAAGFQNSIFSKGQTPYFRSLMIGLASQLLEDGATQTPALPPTVLLAGQLATAIRLTDRLLERGLPVRQVLPQIGFVVDVGNDYFMEIARLRALRLLWWQIGRLYDENLNLVDVFIHARTANAAPPENEPYKNLISNTTQAMSAIIGGCDALTVAGGLASEKDTILAQRIARNVSAVLKEESYFDKVTDMGAGSYLIENLTHQLAKAVWERLGK